MSKKIAAIFICIMLVFATFPDVGRHNSVFAAGTNIYSIDWGQFKAGDKIDNDPKAGLAKSGGANIAVVGSDTKSFYISNRKDNWDALDLQNTYLNLDRNATYEITVTGHMDSGIDTKGANIKLGGVTKKDGEGDGYPEFTKEKLQAGASFVLTYELKLSQVITDDSRELWTLRIQTDEPSGTKAGDLVSFYVDNIVIVQTAAGTEVSPKVPSADTSGLKTITGNEIGKQDGYDYELWKDSGDTTMTLKDGGAFSCSWSNINNVLFRKGMKFDETKTHEQLGGMSVTYDCDYQPKGNSYLGIYGWTSDPLVEYYVIESWGSWRPPGATSKGTITVDGGTYDVYETTRTNQPSIKGTATFQQYWSVRTEKRTSGTISVSEHFRAWESLGMEMGNMYEVALVVEGYQSSGTADVLSNTITVGGNNISQNVIVKLADDNTGSKGDIRKGMAAFGTPEINGKKDDVWNQTEVLPIDKMLQTQDSASGTARVLWDNDNLYVLLEVNAETLDNTSEQAHEHSSAEIFFDESNCKLGSYTDDDGQYRVCYDGSQSFGGSTNTDGFESAATVDGSNYIVEMKIPFKTLKPEANMEIGFDAQINDAKNGTRIGVAKWSDSSDNSWQDTSNWGIITLSAPGATAAFYETYTIKSGDTLWDIAAANLGSALRYPEIQTLNMLTGDLIITGQVLKLPKK